MRLNSMVPAGSNTSLVAKESPENTPPSSMTGAIPANSRIPEACSAISSRSARRRPSAISAPSSVAKGNARWMICGREYSTSRATSPRGTCFAMMSVAVTNSTLMKKIEKKNRNETSTASRNSRAT